MYLQIAPRRSPADINGAREVRSSLQTEYLFTTRALPEIGHKEPLSKLGFTPSSRFHEVPFSVLQAMGLRRP